MPWVCYAALPCCLFDLACLLLSSSHLVFHMSDCVPIATGTLSQPTSLGTCTSSLVCLQLLSLCVQHITSSSHTVFILMCTVRESVVLTVHSFEPSANATLTVWLMSVGATHVEIQQQTALASGSVHILVYDYIYTHMNTGPRYFFTEAETSREVTIYTYTIALTVIYLVLASCTS